MARKMTILALAMVAGFVFLGPGCGGSGAPAPAKTVPRQGRWGIYKLDLATQDVSLIYSTPNTISSSALRLNSLDDTLLFAEKINGTDDSDLEICTVGINGGNFTRITNNSHMDVYPAWSPNDNQIAFLSQGSPFLDIHVMEANGDNEALLFASDNNVADIDWVGDNIVYTYKSQIWIMRSNGTSPTQVTNPPRAGQQGNANLPFGDYDPRMKPDGSQVVFERLEGDSSPHGNYNIYRINSNGTGETPLTSTGHTQGFPSWSHSGDEIVYTVSAIDNQGVYDLYMMNADGTANHNITPDYFPPDFLCHGAIFSNGDSDIYFIGEWYQ